MDKSFRSPLIPFIVNLRARRASLWQAAARQLDALGLGVLPILIDHPAAIIDVIGSYVRLGMPRILLGSGDGTISRSIGPLLGSTTALGLIPLGTGNGIARSLGINSLADSCRAVLSAKTRDISVGCANATYFLNMISIGMSVEVTRCLSKQLKKFVGHGAYLPSIIRAIWQRTEFSVTLSLGAEVLIMPSIQVIVCKGSYAPRWPRLGLISPDDSLSVYVVKQMPLLNLVAMTLIVWGDIPPEGEDLVSRRTSRVVVDAIPPMGASTP